MIAAMGLSAYLGLFIVSFGAATVLPLQSETILVGLILSGEFSLAGLLLVASAGNVLGAVCNWGLGRCIERFRDRPWFPANASSLERAGKWYRRYGRWSLLFSWMPIFGDALTVLAGTLREPLWSFLLLVAVAKTGRYLALAAATLGSQAVIGLL
ncbi:YqaA family protein [Mycoplana dimorpha]|uniref:Membrane protein YqaA with SNARE-associated domain n=1 Tax=Mycoplana dimorpha TaxID=28320 RepID=A0A2T5AZ51_MYCDI|nr:YqaA family protein [Mycoplana dimorpha]PTM92012.1 membrane protein YqaA with SNARE-associated domain [Mycoplana dimorpha]